ncbi:sulfatase family protein [Thalassoroseus pseudoceratinae]|uniref:sulfatase family protein n=1 Tax=Thalassoroseus pseudoceratinae TaxID=2713176 RepID=UPI00141EE379|nr:sulfatase [Thalassoroseus pseudoceratinae]
MISRLGLLVLLCSLSMDRIPIAAAERPNVIFFLSDDQRADFLSCAGHPILKTPNIDALAGRGTRFRNAFVTTSICAASRATLFTGLWERSHKYTFGTPPIAEELIADSYPARLKQSGYRTGFVGKFGVGVPRSAPKQMFDSFVSLNRNPYFKKQADGSTRHLTDLTGDKAIEFLRSCDADQSFCLSVSFNASHAEDSDKKDHYPWPPTEDGLYEDVTIPPPLIEMDFHKQLPKFLQTSMNRDRFYWRWDTPEKYQKNVKAYYRMITGLDRNIGRVLAALDELGRMENTVVVFMGDNGYYKGSRGFAGKWSHYEESLRVPLVVADFRQKPQARVADQMALNVDVPATILDYAIGKIPDRYQGRSLKPIVQGQSPSDWRTDFFCEHLMDRAEIPKWEGVRGDRYVYARYFQHLPEGEFLHDLKTDPEQRINLVGDPKSKEILEQMRKRCDELRDERGGEYTQAKFPTQRYLKSLRNSK